MVYNFRRSYQPWNTWDFTENLDFWLGESWKFWQWGFPFPPGDSWLELSPGCHCGQGESSTVGHRLHPSLLSIQHWLSHLTPGQPHLLLHLIGNHYKMNQLLWSSFSFVKYWLFYVHVILVYIWCHAVYFIFLLRPPLSSRPFISILLLCVHKPVALDGCVVPPGVYPHLTSPVPVWTPTLPPALPYHKECCHEHPCICPLMAWWGNSLIYAKEQKHWVEGYMDS